VYVKKMYMKICGYLGAYIFFPTKNKEIYVYIYIYILYIYIFKEQIDTGHFSSQTYWLPQWTLL